MKAPKGKKKYWAMANFNMALTGILIVLGALFAVWDNNHGINWIYCDPPHGAFSPYIQNTMLKNAIIFISLQD